MARKVRDDQDSDNSPRQARAEARGVLRADVMEQGDLHDKFNLAKLDEIRSFCVEKLGPELYEGVHKFMQSAERGLGAARFAARIRLGDEESPPHAAPEDPASSLPRAGGKGSAEAVGIPYFEEEEAGGGGVRPAEEEAGGGGGGWRRRRRRLIGN